MCNNQSGPQPFCLDRQIFVFQNDCIPTTLHFLHECFFFPFLIVLGDEVSFSELLLIFITETSLPDIGLILRGKNSKKQWLETEALDAAGCIQHPLSSSSPKSEKLNGTKMFDILEFFWAGCTSLSLPRFDCCFNLIVPRYKEINYLPRN